MLTAKAKWFLLIIYVLFIWVLSSFSINTPKLLEKFTFTDKIVHIILFGIMSFLVFNVVTEYTKNLTLTLFLSIVITIFYGGIDEIHQYFVPGRDCSIMDFIADMVGAVIVSFILFRREVRNV